MGNPDPFIEAQFPFSLFEVTGLELEYMIVNRDTLSIAPLCDKLLEAAGELNDNEVYPEGRDGPAAWSNELVLHVVEFKTPKPVPTLAGLDEVFHRQVVRANTLLSRWNACLMPTAMHPWMNPAVETRLWPHGGNEIYAAFDDLFDCKRHGWANLQSIHINLPFANDSEFRKLHSAIRVVLPLLPALAASSPIMDANLTGYPDNRLEVYRKNCARIPQISGKIIPEIVDGREAYESLILRPIYDALTPLDPQKILQHEWINARGAIARFDRGSIEIRLSDIQECPRADVAIAALITAVVKALVDEELSDREEQERLRTDILTETLNDAIRYGSASLLKDPHFLRCLGLPEKAIPQGELWQGLAKKTLPSDSPFFSDLNTIFEEGCLALRMERSIVQGQTPSLHSLYNVLCRCLHNNCMFSCK
ncbi:MAG: glutamate-cysteine ligase family protein [Candidatus Hydrogenedentales bacterium]|jgi:carboxylate-amine ligase